MHPHAHQLLTKSFMMQALVECEGESIDLSGDMGAVGRVVIPDTPSGNSEMYLDLKGIFCFVMIIYVVTTFFIWYNFKYSPSNITRRKLNHFLWQIKIYALIFQ